MSTYLLVGSIPIYETTAAITSRESLKSLPRHLHHLLILYILFYPVLRFEKECWTSLLFLLLLVICEMERCLEDLIESFSHQVGASSPSASISMTLLLSTPENHPRDAHLSLAALGTGLSSSRSALLCYILIEVLGPQPQPCLLRL